MVNTRLYRINLTENQKTELSPAELAFVQLFNICRWGFYSNRHPITIFRGLKNPKKLNLLLQLEAMRAYFAKSPGNVWRETDWEKGMQAWLNRASPIPDKEKLQQSLIKPKKKKVAQQDCDPISQYEQKLREIDYALTDEELQTFKGLLAYLIADFDKKSLDNGMLFFAYHGQERDYMEELLRLRIQDVCKIKDIDIFLAWCYSIQGKYRHMLIHFFSEHVTGQVTAEKDLTHTPKDRFFATETSIAADTPKAEQKPINNDYVKINYDPNKIYTLRDIRSILQNDG